MFTGLGNLGGLSLRNNEISDIQDGTFNSIPQLTRLNLSNNKLTTLRSDMFTGLGNLEYLYLNNNDITDIQAGTLNPTSQLRILNLRNNHIQTIPSNLLANLLQLRYLRLSGNNITTLPSVAYDILSSISTVIIGNNPWQCNCRMVEFRLKMNGSYPFENQITCSQPDSLHGLKLKDVSPEDLICEGPTTGLMSPVTYPPPTTVATEIPETSTVQNF
ncbi:PREDICTED: SLIT and NTRK-like protein 6 [Branchiostoma belcheri]|uniref:SLIT and NTRK-like protein 6 n=1 Tax=Branchiostoma belcheri TaxID=7741 RepID=A0A6P4ZIU4_BRABE|nr:PREDICTED: SLIT and NTRK-like protein 6 [Branchiostoma belcheri]